MKKIIIPIILMLLFTNMHALKVFPIGTGDLVGTYYPTGSAICRLLNKDYKINNIKCYPRTSKGSIENINALHSSSIDFAIAQSDVIFQAQNGQGKFKNKKLNNLRSIMSIYPELLTLVVRKDSNIKNLKDIIGTKINIGTKGSGTQASTLELFKYNQIKKTSFKYLSQLRTSKLSNALKNKEIDGYFYMGGHPSKSIKYIESQNDIKLISLDNKSIDSLLEKNSFYSKGTIKANLYKNNAHTTHTFGVNAVLISKKEASINEVYLLVKTIVENFEAFKKLHPVYSNLKKESLVQGLVAPLHEGAIKYYKEIGLL